ncbi:MAG: hypothetical protein V3T19_04280 [Acidiferrobacterales bacterium]|jgi:hypothetical protein
MAIGGSRSWAIEHATKHPRHAYCKPGRGHPTVNITGDFGRWIKERVRGVIHKDSAINDNIFKEGL